MIYLDPLEQYYKEEFWLEGAPTWEELTEQDKKEISEMYCYRQWLGFKELEKEVQNFEFELRKAVHNSRITQLLNKILKK